MRGLGPGLSQFELLLEELGSPPDEQLAYMLEDLLDRLGIEQHEAQLPVPSLEFAVQEQELDPALGDSDLGLVHESSVDGRGGLGREGKRSQCVIGGPEAVAARPASGVVPTEQATAYPSMTDSAGRASAIGSA